MKIDFHGQFRHFSKFVEKQRYHEDDDGWKPCPCLGFPEYTFNNSATMLYNLFYNEITFEGSSQALEEIEENFLPLLKQYSDELKEYYKTKKRYEITFERFME